MADINLLPVEERTAERFGILRKRLLAVAVVILIFSAVATLVTLGAFTSEASKRSRLIEDVEENSALISSLKANEELIVVVKGKVSVADKIFTSRTNVASVFGQLSQLVPGGVYFTDIRFNQGKLVISGKARNSGEMASFVASLVSDRGSLIVSNVSIDTLSSDETGAYSFVVSSQLTGAQVAKQ